MGMAQYRPYGADIIFKTNAFHHVRMTISIVAEDNQDIMHAKRL